MSTAPRLLEAEEITRQLAELPGVSPSPRGALCLAVQAPSFEDAVQLIRLVADDAERMNHHPDIDLRWTTVIFTLATHSAGGITQLDIELAHQILQACSAVGARALHTPSRIEIAIDVADESAVREFWRVGLGYAERGEDLGPKNGRGPVVWFQDTADDDPRLSVRSRTHLDVYLPEDQIQERLQACLDAGGRLVDDSHAPEWWVLADAEGNELCLCTERPL